MMGSVCRVSVRLERENVSGDTVKVSDILKAFLSETASPTFRQDFYTLESLECQWLYSTFSGERFCLF